jgi:hypothetical protein
MSTLIQFRRDTAANWTSANPVLAEGELGLETDTGAYKIGDGTSNWNGLTYREFTGETQSLILDQQSTDLSAAPAGKMRIYSKTLGGRAIPKFIGPNGLSTAMQPLLARNKVGYWNPPGNGTTVPGVFGYNAPTAIGTATTRSVATTNLFTRMRRLGYVSSTTAANFAGQRQTNAQITLGDGSGLGGFFKVTRFGISDASVVATARTFVGISNSTSAPSNVEPSTLTNAIGVGHGASDTNLKLYYGGSAAQTPIDLGANFPTNTSNTDVYELVLFAPPSTANTVFYEVTRLNTGHTATGTLVASTPGLQLPLATTLLTYMLAWRTNNATAAAVGIDIMSDYIETDD